MNLKKAAMLIQRSFEQIEFDESALEEGRYELSAHIAAEDYYDDDIFCRIVLCDDGTLHAFFTFDKIDETIEAYRLINELNSNNSWFCAYIDNAEEASFLQLHFSSICPKNDKEIADTACFAILRLLDENISALIKPLTALTYSE